MPEVNKIKKMSSDSDVEFIFVSLDETNDNWRAGLKKTGIPGNHYWIVDNFKSDIAQYLKINGIPRYVIINNSGKIEKINAYPPMSGDYGMMSQISKLLSH